MKDKCINAAFICFYLPVFTVIVSYLLSIHFELVSKCIPNLEGCTSISRVGRYPPVNYFFKPMMFIYAIFSAIFWTKFYKILKVEKIETSKFLMLIAYCSILFFILYIFFLGEGKLYKFFRQVGIFIFIFFTVLSQIFFSIKLKKLSCFDYKIGKLIFYYTVILGIIGILLLPLVTTKVVEFANFKNIVSWNYFLFIQIYFLFIFFGLKKKL